MTNNEVKTILLRVRKISKLIKLKTMLKDTLESCLLPKAITYDGDKVMTSPDDKLSEIAGRVIDLDKSIRELQIRKALIASETEEIISRLDDLNERIVLMGYYVSGYPIKRICQEINYSDKHTYRLRNRGIAHLRDLMKDEKNEK